MMDPSIERSPSFLWNSHGAGFREPWTVKFGVRCVRCRILSATAHNRLRQHPLQAAHDVQPRFIVTGPHARLAKGTKVLMTSFDAAGARKSLWTCTVDDLAFEAPKWPVLLGELEIAGAHAL